MWEIIINIVLAVLSVVFAGLSYYFNLKKKIIEQANNEISNAQDITEDNAERMAYVVGQLKKIIPSTVRFIFTDNVIEKLAQAAFDKIKEYAIKHEAEKNK